MCWFHVVSVGTSVLRNLLREDPSLFGWCRDVLEGRDVGVTNEMISKASSYLHTNYGLSAELNAMWEDIEGGNVDRVYLLVSDTLEGFIASKILEDFFKVKGIEVRTIKIVNLGKIFDEGLLNLVDEVSKIINEAEKEKCKVALNLTGGFKPESAFLYLTGCILNATKAYYIHESMRSRVELPIIPLSIPQKWLSILKKIKDVKEYKELIKNIGIKNVVELQDRGLLKENKLRIFIKNIIEKQISSPNNP